MQYKFSDIGEKLSGHSGIAELMDDLGHALSQAGSDKIITMGGGNPAHIPRMQQLWRSRMREILEDEGCFDRAVGNYDPPAGNLRFREAVAGCLREKFDWKLGPENIAITCGGQTAFFFLFTLLAGQSSGQRRSILLPLCPEYIGYADQGLTQAALVARKPIVHELENNRFKYAIDFDNLELGPEIAAICVSRPTNPTGNVLTDDEVAHLAELAQGHGIPLIIDGAYGAPFPNAVFTEIKPVWNPGMILSLSLSKLGLPGTRPGSVVADEEIATRLTAMTGIIGLANPNLGQALVTPLLENGELIRHSQEVIQPYYREKSCQIQSLVEEEFGSSFPFGMHVSEGAFFLWLRFPELPVSSIELYKRLKQRGVLIVPGEYFFYGLDQAEDEWAHRRQCIRVTFSQPDRLMQRGIATLAESLRELH